jgi:hypothetical protein
MKFPVLTCLKIFEELLKQWRIVNNSDCLVCKEKENYKHLYLDCKYNKKYWQEVNKMTTNLYIGDYVFNLESLVFGYKIYDLNLFITLIFFSISDEDKFHIIDFFFSPHVKSRDITRILMSCDISAV